MIGHGAGRIVYNLPYCTKTKGKYQTLKKLLMEKALTLRMGLFYLMESGKLFCLVKINQHLWIVMLIKF